MNKEQFLLRLEQLLSDIPEDERTEALEYYQSYFEDAGVENEANVIEELGSPEKVAQSIREGVNDRGEDTVDHPLVSKTADTGGTGANWSDMKQKFQQKDKRSMWLLAIIVAVFTSPIWLGALGTLFGISISLVSVIAAIILTVVILAFVGLIVGLVLGLVGVIVFFTGHFGSGLMIFGGGLLLAALGCLCAALLIWMSKTVIPAMIGKVSDLMHHGLKRRKGAMRDE